MAHYISYETLLESDPNLKFPFVEKGEIQNVLTEQKIKYKDSK